MLFLFYEEKLQVGGLEDKMAFKTLMKRQCRMVPSMTVRFHKLGRVIISWDLRRKLKTDYVEVLIDEDYNKFALKSSNDAVKGFKLNKSNMFQCSPLRKLEVVGEFKARFTEGKIIIDDFKVSDEIKSLEFWEDKNERGKVRKR